MGWHWYRVTSVPAGCTEYEVDQEIELYVPEPPPNPHTIGSGACTGVTLELIS